MNIFRNQYIILIIKSIMYRILATIETTIIGYLYTNDLKKGLQIGFLDTLVKLVTYYIYEILWIPYLKNNKNNQNIENENYDLINS